MKFEMACATWVKEEDKKVLEVLQKSDRWLTVQELSEITGLSPARVERTLKLLKQQMGFMKTRKKFF